MGGVERLIGTIGSRRYWRRPQATNTLKEIVFKGELNWERGGRESSWKDFFFCASLSCTVLLQQQDDGGDDEFLARKNQWIG